MRRAEKTRIRKTPVISHGFNRQKARWVREVREVSHGSWCPFKKFGVVVSNYSMSDALYVNLNQVNSFRLEIICTVSFGHHRSATHRGLQGCNCRGLWVEPPPVYVYRRSFLSEIGLKFQSLCKISNISTSDPPVLLGQFQHWWAVTNSLGLLLSYGACSEKGRKSHSAGLPVEGLHGDRYVSERRRTRNS